MATKIYKLIQKKNIAIFDLPVNGGKMTVTYTFKDGNQFMPNMPARCTLRDEFYQNLLENTPLFKNGVIKLERTIEDKPKKAGYHLSRPGHRVCVQHMGHCREKRQAGR